MKKKKRSITLLPIVSTEEITLVDKTDLLFKLHYIRTTSDKDKSIVFGMIETILTEKKFKNFFQKCCCAI